MLNTLYIRSYTRQKVGHFHQFHQLLLPLRGVINIEMDGFTGKVTPGECAVIKKGNKHYFTADSEARFVVADMGELPENISSSNTIVFSISQPLLQFLSFVAVQLESQVHKEVERIAYLMFFELMSTQILLKQLNYRIREAVEFIESHLTEKLPIDKLASISCLSPTQFKKLFKEQVGLTTAQYVTKMRMEKALALLTHTDSPLQIISEQVGYTDLSAFSRRFSQHFGLLPSKISR